MVWFGVFLEASNISFDCVSYWRALGFPSFLAFLLFFVWRFLLAQKPYLMGFSVRVCGVNLVFSEDCGD